MSGLTGIFRVKKSDLNDFAGQRIKKIHCASYSKQDGMVSAQCNGVAKPAGWKSKDGRLWFPTTKGVVVVDPQSHPEDNQLAPPVFIEEVMADRRDVTS